MPETERQDMHLGEIRDLAQRFTAREIEECMQLALQQGDNPCYTDSEVEQVMNILAKSQFVRSQLEQGKKPGEAIRELGRRIRAIQG